MEWRSAYAYAWDLAERGVPESAAEIRGLGLNAVSMACSYHAGKFLRPRAAGKVYFPEDGTIYFRHDPVRYGAIKPLPNSILDSRDVLGELCAQTELAVCAWMVLLHNSRLGEADPECCVANAFGDRLIYSLCPSSPDVREFAAALVGDLTANYPVAGVSLETPGFLPFAHGYHHEFALVRANPWLENLLGLCFCPSCMARAAEAGVDAKGLKSRVAKDVDDYLAGDAVLPRDMAESFWLADTRTDGELSAFLDLRCRVVASLVSELRGAARPDAFVAVIPSVGRPTANAWYEGGDIGALAEAAGIVEACFYESSADRVRADLFDVSRRIRGKGELRGILRPGYPDLETADQVRSAVQALRAGGASGISFYNWGFLRQRNLDFIAAALSEDRP